MPKPISTLTRINRQLKAQGIMAMLVRGRGYYYLMGDAASRLPATAIYTYRIEPEDYDRIASEVTDMFKAGNVTVSFQREVR